MLELMKKQAGSHAWQRGLSRSHPRRRAGRWLCWSGLCRRAPQQRLVAGEGGGLALQEVVGKFGKRVWQRLAQLEGHRRALQRLASRWRQRTQIPCQYSA